MKKTVIKLLQKPKLNKPVLVSGLPGMGYVGKLAAEHLLEVLRAKKFAEIMSPHFPHHVVVEPGGILRPLRNELYWARLDGRDIIILAGDVQPVSSEGHYELVDCILNLAEKMGVKRIFTLGGYATGKYSEMQPKVICMGNSKLLKEINSKGIKVEKSGGPVIGTAGLLLGFGQLRGIPGLCFLGETHGMVVDPRAAQAVLEVLAETLGVKFDMTNLKQRAKMAKEILSRIRREAEARETRGREEEKPWYIG
ncbi:MAG: proteasome assembly chaperone family protein [Hadesarchaea archaeon]|nr:MAG: proteasome assembly chaperone family protein [Hadesarchaea archaeon]